MLPRASLSPTDPLAQIIRAAMESRSIEFKESASFEILKWKIAKTSMAMANQRDGGRIVIGISERTDVPDPRIGMQESDLITYDADDILEHVNRYAGPPVRLTARAVEVDNRTYVAIEIEPITGLPVICRRDSPPEASESLRPAEIYVRHVDRVGTTRVTRAEELEELIDIVSERRARDFVARAQRLGLKAPTPDNVAFDTAASDFGI